MAAAQRRMGFVLLLIMLLSGVVWLSSRGTTGLSEGGAQEAAIELDRSYGLDDSRWERVTEPRAFVFPQDHGPHSEYLTEWWYYTGNLEAEDGRRFAYQLTFFRRGVTPDPPMLNSELAMQSLYFAHLAISDVERGSHHEWERFERGAAGLAGAGGSPYRVWLQNWSAEALDREGRQIRLKASNEHASLELDLTALKPIVAHGNQGLSPKSSQVGNASYYLSFTRLETSGSLTVGGERFSVRGSSWFDHEWSTSALGPDAVGWDWFSLQLNDGSELMLFQIRNQDGSLDPASSGTFVRADGSYLPLGAGDFGITSMESWTSPTTGTEYPSGWAITVPGLELDIRVEPVLSDQEMNLSTVYWEGAVVVEGSASGQPVTGMGFVELTGYGQSLQGAF